MSQLMCVLYVDSVDEIVDHLLITSSVVIAAMKGINVLVKQKQFIKLLQLMKEMDQVTTNEQEQKNFSKIFRNSKRIWNIFLFNYAASWSCVALQTIMSPPEKRLWSSTYLVTIDWLHHPFIYIGGYIYQAMSNFCLVFIDIAVDTYAPSLFLILGGHLDVLGNQLQTLGKNTIKPTVDDKIKLVDLCKKYILIIRFID